MNTRIELIAQGTEPFNGQQVLGATRARQASCG